MTNMARILGGREKAKRQTNIGKTSPRKLITGRKEKGRSSLENPPQGLALNRSQRNGLQTARKRRIKSNHECPLCTWEIRLPRNARVGDLILCKGCGGEYELHSLCPLRLQPLNFYNGLDEYPDHI